MIYSKHCQALGGIYAAAALLAIIAVPANGAEVDVELQPPTATIEIDPGEIAMEDDAVVESGNGRKVIIRSSQGPVSAPPGIVVAAPDEEIVIEGKPRKASPPTGPKPPKIEKRIKIHKDGDAQAMARRMERLEQKLEALADRDQMMRKDQFVMNEKQLARVQKEVDRAAREADVAIRKFHFAHPGGEDNFVFEHNIAIAGSVKAERKALEAHRKALEKQLEAIDQRLEKLDDEEEEISGEDRQKKSNVEKDEAVLEETKPSLPPDSAP